MRTGAHADVGRKLRPNRLSLSVRQQLRREVEARQKRLHRRLFIGALGVLVLVAAGIFAGVLFLGQQAPAQAGLSSPTVDANGQQLAAPTEVTLRARDAEAAGADPNDPNILYLPTPLVAQYEDIGIHSPVSANNLTEVAFHQSSLEWGLQLKSLLPVADSAEAEKNHGTNRPVADEQPTGDLPLRGSALSLGRADALGPWDSALDVGATPGTAVYAPISGTVVLVRPYLLYGELDDFELHIQQKGHPELDFILLHIDNVTVAAGDTVIGGVTKVAEVRNIGEVINNQLAYFTVEGDKGNHTHFQLNDTTYPNYTVLDEALDIFRN
ncbi:MAG: M23 family metallopeptidase [Coriobacteriales bacterium]|nr:M23 family metallopeptidase [Coriobacteriales bacterium]